MKDLVIKGTGNSRYLKTSADALAQYPTYTDFMMALQAGLFAIDFNGLNPTGIEESGTPLSKETLLKDTTASALGLSSLATPDDAIAALNTQKTERYTWTGTLIPAGWTQVGTGGYKYQYLAQWPIANTDTPHISAVFPTDDLTSARAIKDAWGLVYNATAEGNYITFYATEEPSVNIPFQVEVIA